ncbi:universal stress protein [Phaeodactylibacter luteus]|uniref:Universal stress protein n=1 Tax=Phaeodactylibacter luteus TaxID=1564516 RepID=A0A5C6RM87_9BACT|nr:universal stress protein [Phaeodactylibacter luteus]TXB62462.1 universal stress protein [Phaeodactylibacter luteus]
MTTFKRALLALDLTETDASLLDFTARHARALGVEKLYVLHIIPDFTAPAGTEADFMSRFAPEVPVDEQIRSRLQARLEAAFAPVKGLEFVLDIREGKPYEKLLHWQKVKKADLLILGKKAISEGSGITAKRVARNAPCSILFVPAAAPGSIEQLVVPNDFSENAGRAIHTALALSSHMKGQPVHSLYVVDLPPADYYNRSEPGRGYRGILMESARLTGNKFRDKLGVADDDLVDVYLENLRQDTAGHILAYAKEHPGTWLVTGAKGHSPFEHFLFGSVTERLAERAGDVPLLIVR